MTSSSGSGQNCPTLWLILGGFALACGRLGYSDHQPAQFLADGAPSPDPLGDPDPDPDAGISILDASANGNTQGEGGSASSGDSGSASNGGVVNGGADGASATTPGLVGFWKLDESSGTTAADSSGNDNHGTLRNFVTPTWTGGTVGGALEFDGVDAMVEVPVSASIDSIAANDTFTIAAWAYLTDADSGTWRPILTQQSRSVLFEEFGLYFQSGELVLIINSDTPPKHTCRVAVNAFERWVFAAATYDGVTGRAYLDGAEVCSIAPSDPDIETPGNPVVLGANVSGRGVDTFQGSLDEILLFSRALTPAQIIDLEAGVLPN